MLSAQFFSSSAGSFMSGERPVVFISDSFFVPGRLPSVCVRAYGEFQ